MSVGEPAKNVRFIEQGHDFVHLGWDGPDGSYWVTWYPTQAMDRSAITWVGNARDLKLTVHPEQDYVFIVNREIDKDLLLPKNVLIRKCKEYKSTNRWMG